MSDIVERLKSQNELYVQKYVGTYDIDETKIEPLCEEAAAEITRLREENARLKTSVGEIIWARDQREKRLREENARLLEALNGWQNWWEGIRPDFAVIVYHRAAAAIGDSRNCVPEGGKDA